MHVALQRLHGSGIHTVTHDPVTAAATYHTHGRSCEENGAASDSWRSLQVLGAHRRRGERLTSRGLGPGGGGRGAPLHVQALAEIGAAAGEGGGLGARRCGRRLSAASPRLRLAGPLSSIPGAALRLFRPRLQLLRRAAPRPPTTIT